MISFYGCPECAKTVIRPSGARRLKSYCTTVERDVYLVRLQDLDSVLEGLGYIALPKPKKIKGARVKR
jgi:hypothetical protein